MVVPATQSHAPRISPGPRATPRSRSHCSSPQLEEMAERYLYAVGTSVPSVRGAGSRSGLVEEPSRQRAHGPGRLRYGTFPTLEGHSARRKLRCELTSRPRLASQRGAKRSPSRSAPTSTYPGLSAPSPQPVRTAPGKTWPRPSSEGTPGLPGFHRVSR